MSSAAEEELSSNVEAIRIATLNDIEI